MEAIPELVHNEENLQSLFFGQRVEAVFFDLDGTLVDTEKETDLAIREIMGEYGRPDAFLQPFYTTGRSWESIGNSLCERYPEARDIPELPQKLAKSWEKFVSINPRTLTGVHQAVEWASKYFPVSVVSSSPRYLIDLLLESTGLDVFFPPHTRIGVDQVSEAKPSPIPFLVAAETLGIDPSYGLVFEDSGAGLIAAKKAGMKSIAIMEVCKDKEMCSQLTDVCIQDFRTLQESFWKRLAGAL